MTRKMESGKGNRVKTEVLESKRRAKNNRDIAPGNKEYFIVDSHVHWGSLHGKPYMSAPIAKVLDINRNCGVNLNLLVGRLDQFLPLPVPEKTLLSGNEEAASIVQKNKDCRMFAVYSPLYPSVRRQVEELARDGCLVGLKLGPCYHGYVIDSPVGDSVFEFLSTLGLPAVAHCQGDPFDSPDQFAKKAAKYPGVRLNLFHMGTTMPKNAHAIALRKNKPGNLRAGCCSSAMMTQFGLLEDCVKLVTAKKIIYGSDIPCNHPAPAIARILNANLTREQKADILGRSAIDFFRLEGINL